MSEEPKKRRTPALSGELKSGVTQVAPLFYSGRETIGKAQTIQNPGRIHSIPA